MLKSKGVRMMLRYEDRFDGAGSEFDAISCRISSLAGPDDSEKAGIVKGDEKYINRAMGLPLSFDKFLRLKDIVKYVGVTENFKEIIDYFKVPQDELPAGFRVEYALERESVLKIDLVRDISYDKNGRKRPTNVLLSADSANPYEVGAIKNIIANLTCNPMVIYDNFINNPEANIGKRFKTRDEVMQELGRILGPGADISVELNNPFADESEILEEAAKFREILSKYRVVIKVPHTGPVNGDNISELLTGDRVFARKYNEGATADFMRGHNIALMLKEHGFRVNFTMMFEPYQTALALQAKPYFINTFYKFRLFQNEVLKNLLSCYKATDERKYLEQIRAYMVEKDYLPQRDKDIDLLEVKKKVEWILEYRKVDSREGADGLDQARHSLRMLRQSNLPDTRLIICSMENEKIYPTIDKMLMEDEFKDMTHRVVLTTMPSYLASFTCAPGAIYYHRGFMSAVKNSPNK
jgi:hypothetical protein